MTDELEPLDEAELEAENGEALPDREVMSIITVPGDSLGPPPVQE